MAAASVSTATSPKGMDMSADESKLFASGGEVTDTFMCHFYSAILHRYEARLSERKISLYLGHYDLSRNRQSGKRPSIKNSRASERRPVPHATVTLLVVNPDKHWTFASIDRRTTVPQCLYHDSLGGHLSVTRAGIYEELLHEYGIERIVEPRDVYQFERPYVTCGIWVCYFIGRYLEYLCTSKPGEPYSMSNDPSYGPCARDKLPDAALIKRNGTHISKCREVYTKYIQRNLTCNILKIRDGDSYYVNCQRPQSSPTATAAAASSSSSNSPASATTMLIE